MESLSTGGTSWLRRDELGLPSGANIAGPRNGDNSHGVGNSSAQRPQSRRNPISREGSHESESSSSSPRIAHTLTACCRCRSVRLYSLLCCNLPSLLGLGLVLFLKILTLRTCSRPLSSDCVFDISHADSLSREKPGVMQEFHGVIHVSVLVAHANTSTLRKAQRYLEHMSLIFKIECDSSKRSSCARQKRRVGSSARKNYSEGQIS
jgi:hypothetical protein